MTFHQALQGISKPVFFQKICGYSYDRAGHFADKTYGELPKDFQDGIVVLIHEVYTIQKMVYNYELDFTVRYMKKAGIKLRPFFDGCGLNKTFYRTLNTNRHRHAKLIAIRLGLIRLLNRLFGYVLQN